ncbi:phosphatidylinositol 3-kinase VPS34 [Parastagonospora nodorum]|nr:phosphatidylinositol 3-kinase VPS34 [Parastagonospora nodorum]KAH4016144.1 phosphatidylinositol 3-kinase VPS34 [Parastagonospora nodorum]KAH4047033.1 phosphatidylinositol 3-kinase VPS34 [Parastagonospora nodorum]KAH4100817.1 phosphatidylinositol 3-kinase VPS34 [Parastagonospora nodorum]KAH4183679.1 phosphatidylinositol 3-kinase VPS34 [Parastagonospora nodorum]
MEAFNFATSLDLTELNVHVRIDRLDGTQKPVPYSVLLKRPDLRHRASITNPHFELYVTAQIWADSKPLTVPVQTAYKSFKNARIWNEWLQLPVTYSNLPASAQLNITVWDLSPAEDTDSNLHAVPFGGTTIPLFDKNNTLQKGRQRCRIHRFKAADGLADTTTPWILPQARRSRKAQMAEDTVDEQVTEMQRLEELLKKQEMGDLPTNTWLDGLVYKKMMKIRNEALKAEATALNRQSKTDGDAGGEDEQELFYLEIEFPRFDHAVVFTDVEYPPPPVSDLRLPVETDVRLRPPPEVSFGPDIDIDGVGYGDADAGRLIKIYDPEIGRRVNPAEDKHRELMRSQQTDSLDRDRKPNVHVRDKLNLLMAKGPLEEITSHERDDIWKFRYFLLRDKRALTKFVKCVNWKNPREARQAAPLLDKWAEIDVDDALELLGPHFDHPVVRSYAVERLKKADDEELQLYLLQLVQALKYEAPGEGDDSSLARFLITRAANSFALGNFFHWYLMVEISDFSTDQEPEHRDLFAKVEYDFMVELEKTPEGVETRNTFRRQGELLTVLAKISKDVRFGGGDRSTKLARLKKAISDPKNELANFEPLPLPLDPSVYITGITDECNVLKSSLLPMVLNFKTTTDNKYPIIFKTGDDLRQDQLVIQIITLMDRLLRKENLDLKLTPYRILATSTSAGAFQFVPSMSIAAACQKHKGSLLAYLRANNPDDSAPLGVRKEAMDTYIKSCAGYCVITYLLGVGDRHLDNLLLAPDGRFFHVDFGYILGRDPKPFAPQMKLCREMIEGMGGAQHPNYLAFKSYAFTAWSTLRKSSNLLLNLFALMQGANIPDIKVEREGSVGKVRERMWLGRSEGEAEVLFERLIEESMGDWKAGVIDWAHEFVQTYWRK